MGEKKILLDRSKVNILLEKNGFWNGLERVLHSFEFRNNWTALQGTGRIKSDSLKYICIIARSGNLGH